ncbi:hypothetical protein PIB30_021498 [Stylosanthes scabra]|uniref:Protein kinase domain-containing protein n=1 Tax=Stylosanthes scabra TaxID=79078 RepID=A0ABU6Z5H7_9FABA|nr:hypothetical protein [Stylosanthes scabra]
MQHANVRSKNVVVDDFFVARLTGFDLDKLMVPSLADEMVALVKADGYKAPKLQNGEMQFQDSCLCRWDTAAGDFNWEEARETWKKQSIRGLAGDGEGDGFEESTRLRWIRVVLLRQPEMLRRWKPLTIGHEC